MTTDKQQHGTGQDGEEHAALRKMRDLGAELVEGVHGQASPQVTWTVMVCATVAVPSLTLTVKVSSWAPPLAA